MELLPFQREAVEKLQYATNVLIGDDMGLGKTVEAIALDAHRRHNAVLPKGKPHTLIVSISGAMVQSWERHYNKWAPHLSVAVCNPKDRDTFEGQITSGLHDVYIVHWQALRLLKAPLSKHWFHIVADEVQNAKNRKAQQTVALKKLSTQFKTGLSGTAADNKPEDLWSILNWLYPRTWSSYWRFYNHHIVFVSEVTASGRSFRKVIGLAYEDEIHRAMEPFYIRRLKSDPAIQIQLPEKTYTTLWVDLDTQQRRAYDQMKRHMIAWVGEQDQEEPVAAPVVIAQLMRLQQFASAYATLESYLRKEKRTDRYTGEVTVKMVPAQRVRLCEPSSKLDEVMNLVENNPDESIVVFSQSKQMINLLHKRLEAKKIPTSILTGDVPMGDRDAVVQDFEAGRTRVFAGTIAAGGTGITLTRASTVVFLDRAWNTSANRQAEDRLHRIGQRKAVQVIDIVARNTVDLGRLQRLQLKWSWIARILGDPTSEQKWIDVPELAQQLKDYT